MRTLVRDVWHAIGLYFQPGRRRGRRPVIDRHSLGEFLDSRASFVAQTSLYGYLRTRAGMRYPELFSDDAFVAAINVAKWYLWLACLSDVSVYAGGLIVRRRPGAATEVSRLMSDVVGQILRETGVPADAGSDFQNRAGCVLARLASCDFAAVTDDAEVFVESPSALVQFAPVVEELKALDEGIVRNSVRFRWQEVRRDLRKLLDADAVMASAG